MDAQFTAWLAARRVCSDGLHLCLGWLPSLLTVHWFHFKSHCTDALLLLVDPDFKCMPVPPGGHDFLTKQTALSLVAKQHLIRLAAMLKQSFTI
jgi:hypothetical protein